MEWWAARGPGRRHADPLHDGQRPCMTCARTLSFRSIKTRPERARGRSRSTAVSKISLPPSITRTRSASATASSTSWVTNTADKPAFQPKPLDQVLHLQPGERVQSAQRLIKQDEFRRARQGARQGDALALAARQNQRPLAFTCGQTDLFERRASDLASIRPASASPAGRSRERTTTEATRRPETLTGPAG